MSPVVKISLKSSSKSINVKAKTKRNDDGILEYYIQKERAAEYQLKETTENTEYTFSNLEKNQRYKVKVIAKSPNGLTGEDIAIITTNSIQNIRKSEIEYAYNTDWTNKNVVITANITKPTKYSKYKLYLGTDMENCNALASEGLTVTKNTLVWAVLKDNDNESGTSPVNIVDISNIDKLAPTVTYTETHTTNGIKVTANATDTGSGVKEYRFSSNGGTNWTTWQTSNEYTFANLIQTTDYSIKVEAKDNSGNVGSSTTGTTRTNTVAGLTITPSTTGWTNQNITATIIAANSNYSKIRYTTNGTLPTATTGTEIASGGTVIINSNCTIYAIAYDSTNQTGPTASLAISKIDKTAPTLTLAQNLDTPGQSEITITSDVENKYANQAPYTVSNGGTGTNTNVSSIEQGPVATSPTWKMVKNGDGSVWNGIAYNDLTATSGSKLLVSYYYKTTAPAGYDVFGVLGSIHRNWTTYYNFSRLDYDNRIIADGNWHYNYDLVQINEDVQNVTASYIPAWIYSSQAGTMYINGLNWRVIPSSNTTAADIHVRKYTKGTQTVDYFKNGGGTQIAGNKFTVTDNGTYTVYVEDLAGNGRVEMVNVAISNWKVSVNPNGGTYNNATGIQTIIGKMGDDISLATPVRSGYEFDGWELTGSGYVGERQFTDSNFSQGTYGITGYDWNGLVEVSRQEKSADNPIGNYELKVQTNMGSYPGYGGFVQYCQAVANKKFVHVFVAKLPEGYSFNPTGNSLGSGGSRRWLTSSAGTGKWEIYAYETICGNSGTFSTFGEDGMEEKVVLGIIVMMNHAEAEAGATSIQNSLIGDGQLKNYDSSKSNVLIVAGAGGGGATGYLALGKPGGGLAGGNSSTLGSRNMTIYGGTQTSGYKFGEGGSAVHKMVNSEISGAGSGWYGGYATEDVADELYDQGGTGGSGYIGGVSDGQTISGDSAIPTHDGSSTMTGNYGNGYAKITYLGN